MNFAPSPALTFGLELELQLVDIATGRLAPIAPELLEAMAGTRMGPHVAMEATCATVEFNSSVHTRADDMRAEVRDCLLHIRELTRSRHVDIRGGGTHMSQFWNERVRAPSERALVLEQRFGFLPKRFSTYGMHVHIGMPDAEQAIVVANVLQSLAPLLIAMSCASPYLQFADTGFAACRPLEPLVYPHGGPLPFLRDWAHFETVVQAYCDTGIAQGLKDLYWDVRPKPEFGTVEVRVFDTPLTVDKAVRLAAWTRALAGLVLAGRLSPPARDTDDTAGRVSRFVACRDGLAAQLHDPWQRAWRPARQWMTSLLREIEATQPTPQDMPQVRQIVAGLEAREDHALMRAHWQAISARTPSGQTPDAAMLATYSNALSKLLLADD